LPGINNYDIMDFGIGQKTFVDGSLPRLAARREGKQLILKTKKTKQNQMRVFKITESEVSIAIPVMLPGENCFGFFNGPKGETSAGAHYLRLTRRDFSPAKAYDWQKERYELFCPDPPRSNQLRLDPSLYDDLGNRIYFLRRSCSLSSSCICLLNVHPRKGGIVTFSWDKEATVIGWGIGSCARQLKRGGARRATEVEYPVILCQPGAHFTWINHGLLFGSPGDVGATWDGNLLRVAPQPLMPALAERLEQRCYARP